MDGGATWIGAGAALVLAALIGSVVVGLVVEFFVRPDSAKYDIPRSGDDEASK